MARRIFLFKITICVLILFWGSWNTHKHMANMGRYDYPFLDWIIDGYKIYYLKSPESKEDLLKLLKDYKKGNKDYYLSYSISKFKKNVKRIEWVSDSNYSMLMENGHIISDYIYPFEPWMYNIYTIPSYLRGVHCFDRNGKPVKKKIENKIKQGIREIRSRYPRGKYIILPGEEEERYLILKYDPINKLHAYGEDFEEYVKGPYFEEIEAYFQKITKKYNLSRIVFSTVLCFPRDSIPK